MCPYLDDMHLSVVLFKTDPAIL